MLWRRTARLRSARFAQRGGAEASAVGERCPRAGEDAIARRPGERGAARRHGLLQGDAEIGGDLRGSHRACGGAALHVALRFEAGVLAAEVNVLEALLLGAGELRVLTDLVAGVA